MGMTSQWQDNNMTS